MSNDPIHVTPLPTRFADGEPSALLQRDTFVPYAVYLIMGINILMFLVTSALSRSIIDMDGEALYRCGMMYAPAVWDGQWWRLLTSMFLHGGIMHIVVNMWALRNLGAELERLYGPLPFALLYLAAGWAGSLASLFFSRAAVGSVGASGAIFGLAGAWLAIALRRRQYFQAFGQQVLMIVVINLVIGASMHGIIDNNAHFGGLAGGFMLGLLMPNLLPEFRARWRWLAAIVAVALLFAATPMGIRLSFNRHVEEMGGQLPE